MRGASLRRIVTAQEAAVVGWLLDNAPFCDVTPYRRHALEGLRVVEGCDCGCFSLHFQPRGQGGTSMIADALAVYPDGQQANLILWGRDGEITWLEIVEYDPRAPHRFPEISNLRTWEQRGLELP